MTAVKAVDWLVPGDIRTLTGGYLYDARIVAGLGELGWQPTVHSLAASFPEPDARAVAAADRVLGSIPAEHLVVVDGLALPGLVEALGRQSRPERIVALVHHPVAYETGLSAARAALLFERERAALARVGSVVVTGNWTRRELAKFDVAENRITVVEPGTDAAPLACGGGGDGLQLISVASLTARKGHAVLFEALARVKDRPWRLWCAGSETREPATAHSVKRQVERAGLTERVEWLGELAPAALEGYYHRADLFVLASHLEGYGMAIAEAIARGLPVLSTRAGAIPDTVPAGAGLLVPPGDVAALARALAALLDDRAALDALATRAKAARAHLPSWADASRAFAAALERARSS